MGSPRQRVPPFSRTPSWMPTNTCECVSYCVLTASDTARVAFLRLRCGLLVVLLLLVLPVLLALPLLLAMTLLLTRAPSVMSAYASQLLSIAQFVGGETTRNWQLFVSTTPEHVPKFRELPATTFV